MIYERIIGYSCRYAQAQRQRDTGVRERVRAGWGGRSWGEGVHAADWIEGRRGE